MFKRAEPALCPRRQPLGSGDWLADDAATLACFHPGAAACYRSRLLFPSAQADGHQQQCCYESTGDLAVPKEPGDVGPAARAAGTPDFAGVSLPATLPSRPVPRSLRDRKALELEHKYAEAKAMAPHARLDVLPYLAFEGSVARYHRYWPPNLGPIHVMASEPNDAGISLSRGDIVLIELVEGRPGASLSVVKFDERGSSDPVQTIRGLACVAARSPGRLGFAIASPPVQQVAYVAWRRLLGANQCPSPVIWLR